MATLHFRDLQRMLSESNQEGVYPDPEEGFLIELRFDDPINRPSAVDTELKDRVITADCPFGMVTIEFDEFGQLKSLEIS